MGELERIEDQLRRGLVAGRGMARPSWSCSPGSPQPRPTHGRSRGLAASGSWSSTSAARTASSSADCEGTRLSSHPTRTGRRCLSRPRPTGRRRARGSGH